MPGIRSPLPARQGLFRHPGWLVLGGFVVAIALGTAGLSLPAATAPGRDTGLEDALFTAASAVTVTGLTSVDTATHWSPFGQGVILALIQLGGLGILTSASLLFMVVARRVGLRRRLAAQMEVRSPDLGGLRRLIVLIVATSLTIELLVASVLVSRLWLGYDRPFTTALWEGGFHAVAAFNNSGFTILDQGLVPMASDAAILLPIAMAVIVGGLGFPVWAELSRRPGPVAGWSIHTKITLFATGVLLVVGFVAITAFEWSNPDTLGQHDPATRLLGGLFAGVMPRTAGFTTIDYSLVGPDTLIISDILMIIGGGSGGTAGGLKVTTVAVLALVVWAELRGDREVVAFRRRIPLSIQRQALTLLAVFAALIATSTVVLCAVTGLEPGRAFTECVAAATTAGLSTGVTEELGPAGKAVLVPLMLVGRIGPLTVGAALILRERERRFSHPEERIMVV